MKLNITKDGQTWTASLCGKLDTIISEQFGEDIVPLLQNADKEIILDCTELSYICSSGLRQFLILRKEADKKGGKVSIRFSAPNNEILKILEITGFDKLFKIEQK